MSRREEDDLGGWDDLSPDYRWAVSRYVARTRKYQSPTYQPTNREQSDRQHRIEDEENRRRLGGA